MTELRQFYVHREQEKIGRGATMTYPIHMTFQVLLSFIRILPIAVIELLYTGKVSMPSLVLFCSISN